MVAMAAEQSFPFWRAYGVICSAWVKYNNGNVAEGLSLLRNGLAAYRATGVKMYMSHHVALLARACEIAGRVEEASTLLDESLQFVDATGGRWFAAELNRLRGQMHLHQGHFGAAEELYCKALSIAKEQEAKLWELRAAAALARLLCDQARRVEARDVLAPVYWWFTEGFNTQDLQVSRALLEDLG